MHSSFSDPTTRHKKDNSRCVPAARRARDMQSNAILVDAAPAGVGDAGAVPPEPKSASPGRLRTSADERVLSGRHAVVIA